MTNSNNNSLKARLEAMIASVNADANATAEEREMAKQAEATLAKAVAEQAEAARQNAIWRRRCTGVYGR
jgi:hypothetical protein